MKTTTPKAQLPAALRPAFWGLCALPCLAAPAVAQHAAPQDLATNTPPASALHRGAVPAAPPARPAAPLAVRALAAAATDQGVLLTWNAPAGKPPGRFEVERSTDGATFRAVGAAGPTEAAEGASYRFVDAHPAPPPVYYRLRAAGAGAVSEVLTYAGTDAWQPGPNPATDWLSCGPASGDYRIQDAAGRTVLTGRLSAGQRIDVRRLRNGNYTLELRTGAVRATRSFLKFAAPEHP